MKNILNIVAVFLVSLSLTGCFQVDQKITLSPDGSGTLEETFMVNSAISGSISALSGGMGEQTEVINKDKAPPAKQSMFKEEDVRKKAESYGADVRFVKMERINTPQFEGYKAVYSFRNINTLRLDQGSPKMPGQAPQTSETKEGTTFVFTPGKTAKLVVKQPKKELAAVGPVPETPAAVAETNPEQLAMMRQMFSGLRVSTTLVIKGNVIKSNATHRTGSTIILADVDFSKI